MTGLRNTFPPGHTSVTVESDFGCPDALGTLRAVKVPTGHARDVGRAVGEAAMREARQGFREGARGVGALTEAGKQGLKQAGPILAADEATTATNRNALYAATSRRPFIRKYNSELAIKGYREMKKADLAATITF